MRPRIVLAARRDVAMTGHPTQRVAFAQHLGQLHKPSILRRGESMITVALEFDTEGEIIAALARLEARHTRVPGTTISGHELHQFAAPTDQEVRRYPQLGDALEERMLVGGQRAGEEALDRIAGESPGGQTDVVDDQQIGGHAIGPGVVMGRRHVANPGEPARGRRRPAQMAAMAQLMSRRCIR